MKSNFFRAMRHNKVSPDESVKIFRELLEMSPSEPVAASCIPQSTISAIEYERIQSGIEKAKSFARGKTENA